jgi:Secretion system C-terminal sorting domain/SprB repeat
VPELTLPLYVINVQVSNSEQGQNNGSISVYVGGGLSPYTYQWSNGVVTQSATINGLAPGTYSCTINDTSGKCHLTQTYNVGENASGLINDGVQERSSANKPNQITLHPNPAQNTVSIHLPITADGSETVWQLAVLDALGRVVYLQKHSQDAEVDVSNWAQGLYQVRAQQVNAPDKRPVWAKLAIQRD